MRADAMADGEKRQLVLEEKGGVASTCSATPKVFPRCVAVLAYGAMDVKPLNIRTFPFKDSVRAFEIASQAPPGVVARQIVPEHRGEQRP